MKKKLNISLLLSVLGFLICASTSQAQVTATARVTLTVIPAPGINFSPTSSTKNLSSVNQTNNGGITLRTSSNVAIVLHSSDNDKVPNTNNFSQGQTKTFTSKELSGVSSVEVVYLGS